MVSSYRLKNFLVIIYRIEFIDIMLIIIVKCDIIMHTGTHRSQVILMAPSNGQFNYLKETQWFIIGLVTGVSKPNLKLT